MTTAAAGIDVSGKSPDIRPGGRDHAATNDTDGFRKVARLPGKGRRSGSSRRPRDGCTGPSCSRCMTGASRSSWRPPPVPGPPQGRRRAGEDRQGRRARAGRPARRVPGHGAHRAGRRHRRQAPRHARAAGGPRRPARGTEGGPGRGRRAGRGRPRPGGAGGTGRRRRRVRPADRGARRGVGGPGGELRHPAPVPGIGPVTAASPVAWAGGPGAIGNRRAAAPVGVAPFARDSGTLRGGRHMTGGRRRPRDVLYMAAMAACMSGPDMMEMHGRPGPRGQGPQGRRDRGHAEARRHRECAAPRPAHLGGQVGGRRLTPGRAAPPGGPPGPEGNQPSGRALAAGPPAPARTAAGMWTGCGKPRSRPPGKGRIRA